MVDFRSFFLAQPFLRRQGQLNHNFRKEIHSSTVCYWFRNEGNGGEKIHCLCFCWSFSFFVDGFCCEVNYRLHPTSVFWLNALQKTKKQLIHGQWRWEVSLSKKDWYVFFFSLPYLCLKFVFFIFQLSKHRWRWSMKENQDFFLEGMICMCELRKFLRGKFLTAIWFLIWIEGEGG